MLFGDEHVRRYRETGGEVGYLWNDVTTLILETTGRHSGKPRAKALIFGQDGDRYVVVASKGGARRHPDWYLNLLDNPKVEVQVRNEVFARGRARPRARSANGCGTRWRRSGRPTTTTSARRTGRSRWSCWSARSHRGGRRTAAVVLERTEPSPEGGGRLPLAGEWRGASLPGWSARFLPAPEVSVGGRRLRSARPMRRRAGGPDAKLR